MGKTLRELELEDKLKELEAKILFEQRKVMLRNAFLGKFNRDDLRQVDNAIEKVKQGKVETEKALDERTKQIKANERHKLEEKMKIHLKVKKQARGKQEKKKGKKKKAQQQQQQQNQEQSQAAATTSSA